MSATWCDGPVSPASRMTPKPSTPTSTTPSAAPTRHRDTGEPTIAAMPAGTSSSTNSMPQNPVTDAICSTTGTSPMLFAGVPITPVGLVTPTRYSTPVHTAGALTVASNGMPRTTRARKSNTAAVSVAAEPALIPSAIGSGTSVECRECAQLFDDPSTPARKAAAAASRADTRGASSNTGSGASQVSAGTGVKPVPKKDNNPEQSAAPRPANSRSRFESIENPPHRPRAQRTEVLFGQTDAPAQVELDQALGGRGEDQR